MVGRADVEKVFRAWFGAFLDLKIRTDSLVIDGNRVAQVLSLEGTDIGGFMGLPATGKSCRFAAVCLYDFAGRQIARERRIYCVPDEFLNTPAPTLMDGLHALAGIVHPEIFPAHPRVRRIGH